MIKIILFFTMLLLNENSYYESVYIYEYAIKKPNRALIGFIVTKNNAIIENFEYKISFSKNKIKKVKEIKKNGYENYQYHVKNNGDIIIENLNLECYTCENFSKKNKLIPDKIYQIISKEFFHMTNYDRQKLLESYLE